MARAIPKRTHGLHEAAASRVPGGTAGAACVAGVRRSLSASHCLCAERPESLVVGCRAGGGEGARAPARRTAALN